MTSKRIALVVEGSRGDVQPYVVAALALRRSGYEVLVLGPQAMDGFVQPYGLDFFEFFPVNAKLDCQKEEMVQTFTENNFFRLTQSMSETKTQVREEILTKLVTALKEWRPHLIFACYLSLCDCLNIGIGLKIPVLFLGLQVMIASNYIPAFGMFPQLPTTFSLNRRLWNYLCESYAREMNGSSEAILKKLLGLEAEQFQPTMEEFYGLCSCDAEYPIILAASPTLHGPVPMDFTPQVRLVGGLLLETEQQKGVEFGGDLKALEAFLEGEKPVYMGYGSMTCVSSKFMTLLSLRALMRTGRRGLILGGWAELSEKAFEGEEDEEELRAYCKDKVFFTSTAPHALVFPKCAVVVHHGGAGTLNASAKSGTPTVVAPIFLDQFYHARVVNEKGFGVGLPAMKALCPEELAEAIVKCLSVEVQRRAQEVAEELSREHGAETLVQLVDRFMVEYVDTGRFLAERDALRKKVLENTWSSTFRAWVGCCSERREAA